MKIPAVEVKVPNATQFVACGCEDALAIRPTFIEAFKYPYCAYVACFNDRGNKIAEYKCFDDDFVTDEW